MSTDTSQHTKPTPAVLSEEGISIARRLQFHGPQPSYFGVPRAHAEPMMAGGFVGDTRDGGSCNAELITLNPHCHGTHTECVGHVTDARLNAIDIVPGRRLSAAVVSLTPVRAKAINDIKPNATRDEDMLLSADALRATLPAEPVEAVVIRTLPNPADKRHKQYLDSKDYPYLSISAVAVLIEAGIRHLLIDTPSLDRLDDNGELAVHRAFWNLPPGGRVVDAHTRAGNTVTEMIYVDDDVPDGRYMLSLQVAPFTGDATPANPLLYRYEE